MGVTGHRLRRLYAADCDLAATRTRIRDALTQIKRAVAEAATWHPGVYADGEPVLRIVSPLAEGSDQIVAQEALSLGYSLDVILPFAPDDYKRNFEQLADAASPDPSAQFDDIIARDGVASVRVLDGGVSDDERPGSYLAVGDAMLWHCDIMIAVWDGTPAKGRGGTEEIVRDARAREIPVIWINPTDTRAYTMILPERSPLALDGRDSLGGAVRDLVALPESPAPEGSEAIVSPLTEYLFTRPMRWSMTGLFDVLVRVTAGEMPFRRAATRSAAAEIERDLSGPWTEAEYVPALRSERGTSLRESFVWANALANEYAALYRTTFSVLYLMAPFAVLAALFAHFGPKLYRGAPGFWWGIACVELVLLSLILWMYALASRHRYHSRWIDYRSLAEQLRQLVFLWPAGRPTRTLRLQGESATEASEFTWIAWYCRAVVRELGVCGGTLNADYINGCRSLILDAIVADQISYHTRNEQRMHRVHHRLHLLATALFALATLIAVIHLADPALSRLAASRSARDDVQGIGLLAVLAVMLPTIAASVHGFISQGDFWNLARRSRRMRDELGRLRERIADTELRGSTLADLADQTAGILRDEVVNWRLFVRLKPISLV